MNRVFGRCLMHCAIGSFRWGCPVETMVYFLTKWQKMVASREGRGRARGSCLLGEMRVEILRYTSNRKRRWLEGSQACDPAVRGKVGAPIHRVKPWKERFRR